MIETRICGKFDVSSKYLVFGLPCVAILFGLGPAAAIEVDAKSASWQN